MPRRSRIDTPRSLHHIMCRGIEKRKIFDIDADREHFLERLGEILRAAEEAMEKRYALRSRGFDLEKTATRVADVLGVKDEDVWAKGRYRRIVEARSLTLQDSLIATASRLEFLPYQVTYPSRFSSC